MAKDTMKTCKNCGAGIPSDAKVCPFCGVKIKPPIYKRAWFIILVVLVVVGIIGGGAGSKKSSGPQKIDEVTNETSETSDNTSGSGGQTEPEPSAEPQEEAKDVYLVGDIIKDGDVKIVYVACGDYTEDNEFMQPEEGNKYVFFKFAFINEGKSDSGITMFDFEGYADGYACDMHYTDDDDLSATLSAGRSTSGSIYFEVPADAEEIEVEYSTNYFTSEKIKFAFEGDKDSGYVLEKNKSRTDGAYAVGDVVEGTDVIITYLSCENYESDNMFIQPSEGCHYVRLELEFENTGKSDKSVSSFSFNCYADGIACEQEFFLDDDLSGTISAGRKIKGTVTFEVPDGAEVVEAEYDDNFWTSHKIVFTVK